MQIDIEPGRDESYFVDYVRKVIHMDRGMPLRLECWKRLSSDRPFHFVVTNISDGTKWLIRTPIEWFDSVSTWRTKIALCRLVIWGIPYSLLLPHERPQLISARKVIE